MSSAAWRRVAEAVERAGVVPGRLISRGTIAYAVHVSQRVGAIVVGCQQVSMVGRADRDHDMVGEVRTLYCSEGVRRSVLSNDEGLLVVRVAAAAGGCVPVRVFSSEAPRARQLVLP